MRLSHLLCCTGTLLLVSLTACKDSPTTPPAETPTTETPTFASGKRTPTFVISLADAAPGDLATRVAQAGGRLKNVNAEAGVATAESDAADFETKLRAVPGVEGVGHDRIFQWVDPNQRFQVVEDNKGKNGKVGATERWFPIMWNLQAIHAPDAWRHGEFGKGARVAVLDGGIWDQHVDIAPNLDVARSKSFVEGQPFNNDVGTFWHATHVAGIIAAADNADNLGTIGIAPKATIIGVKVLHNGSGSFEQVINGIIYAATPIRKGGAGADIINMSLGATFIPTPEDLELLKAMDKATRYARRQGTLVIASAGNGDDQGIGIDHDHTDFVTIPAQSAGVVGVSALGPVGYALGAHNFDRLASYSNFGKSIVDLSGPGGDFVLPGDDICTLAINPAPPTATTSSTTNFCWVFDMVVSSCRGTTTSNVCFAAGTSMAAPAVSGVAALIVGKRGHMDPEDLFERLAKSADDLGRRGTDAIYGRGRVNAGRAAR